MPEEIPRLHQSIGKLLVTECPAVGMAKYLEEGGKPTRLMERGTLVDQMVFGGANFHIIDSVYKSGDRKGEKVTDMTGGDAKEQAKAARSKGMIPCLPHEYDAARELAGVIRSKLLLEGIDLSECKMQQELEWTGEAGCPCAGTPDMILDNDTIDLKVGYTANPDTLEDHLYDQGWHIQGAAYQEAMGARGRHWLICAETKSGVNCVTICPLSPAFLDIGRKRWLQAQQIWMQGWKTGEWPEYKSRTLFPSRRVMFKEGILA